MSNFGVRLLEERTRLDLSQEDFGALGGVSKFSQLAYEKGTRHPDADYLARISAHGVDVGFLFTGQRMQPAKDDPANDALSDEPQTVMRAVTREEAALLDNYEAADERGRAAARSVLDALAQPKRANG